MSRTRIVGGLVLMTVSLGFVCPQLAQIRADGTLPPLGILLLVVGIAGTLIGMRCGVQGIRRRAARPMP